MPVEPHKARNRDRSILTSWVDGYNAKKRRFMQVETNTEFYIYALTDPRGFKIKYIGVSLKPEQQFHSHVNHQRFDSYQVDEWIENIQGFGYDPIMLLVEKCVATSRKERHTGYGFFRDTGAI
jgi:hypothetical protein